MGENSLGYQLCGILLKRPILHQSTRWSKRFFIVKDSCLVYYLENDKKDFETKKKFNIHPQGVIPLGDCRVSVVSDASTEFAFKIQQDCVGSDLLLAADSEFSRSKWMQTITTAARITHGNAQLGTSMVERLETEGLKNAIEREKCNERLRSESEALQSEKERNQELEEAAKALKEEKSEFEGLSRDLQIALDVIRRQLEETTTALDGVEEEKTYLKDASDNLQKNLQELKAEQKTAEAALEQAQQQLVEQRTVEVALEEAQQQLVEQISAEAALEQAQQQLIEQNSQKSEEQTRLLARLEQIEHEVDTLHTERDLTAQKLKETEELAEKLKEEKQDIHTHTEELEENIKELRKRKSDAERELEQEARLRREAEAQLKSAEEALNSLQGAVSHTTHKIDSQTKEKMQSDVKKLRNFFEKVALESLYDAKKPMIMKNALAACKTDVLLSRARQIRRESQMRFSRIQLKGISESGGSKCPVATRKQARMTQLSPI